MNNECSNRTLVDIIGHIFIVVSLLVGTNLISYAKGRESMLNEEGSENE